MPSELQAEVDRKPPDERQRIEQIWQLAGRVDDDAPGAPDLDTAWADLERRVGERPASARPAHRAPDRGPRARVPLRLVLSMTAGIAALLVVGLWQWQLPVVVMAPAGEQLTVNLPDGSTVELNSATRLRYRRGFRHWPLVAASERTVLLDGEAYFDVAHDGRPFVVETFNARVEVLGTEFNILARRGGQEAETRVTLASGRVRVTSAARPDEGTLLAREGETAVVADTTRSSRPRTLARLQLDQVLAWRRQGFAAVDQPVRDVLAEIERRYALRVETEGALPLDDQVYIVYRSDTSPENILHDLCLTQGCRFRRTSHGFVVFPATP